VGGQRYIVSHPKHLIQGGKLKSREGRQSKKIGANAPIPFFPILFRIHAGIYQTCDKTFIQHQICMNMTSFIKNERNRPMSELIQKIIASVLLRKSVFINKQLQTSNG